MDTLDSGVMHTAADAVESVLQEADTDIIHTVTVTLNGQHGGADVVIEGFDFDESEFEVTVEIHE
jgi:hypothetical protein